MFVKCIWMERVSCLKKFNPIMSASLGFGLHYGGNFDILSARLSTDVERPVKIMWLNPKLSRLSFGNYFDKIINFLGEQHCKT